MAGESLTDGRCVSASHAHTAQVLPLRSALGKERLRLRSGWEMHCRYDNNSQESVEVMERHEREVSHCWKTVRGPGSYRPTTAWSKAATLIVSR